MQDREELREIESLGLEEDPLPPDPEEQGEGGSLLPLLQGIVCLILLAALLLLRYTDQPSYNAFTQWYRQKAAEEIQLPQWEEGSSTPSPQASPTPSPGVSPAPWEEETSLQRL